MNGRGVSAALLAVTVLSTWLASPLFAFELLRSSGRTCSADPNLRWSPAQIRIDTGELEDSDRALADSAVSAWRTVLGARLRFTVGNGRICDLNDSVTTLAFTELDCQGARYDRDTLAITVTSWRGSRITDADVSFNAGATLSGAQFRQVAMHELGHVLGLDHSDACGDPGAGTLMNSSLVERFDAPQQDDINGARFIYGGAASGTPTPLPDVGVPEGSNGCAVVEPTADGVLPLSLGLFLVVFAGRRERSSRGSSGRKLFR